jgi:hypothetical protein
MQPPTAFSLRMTSPRANEVRTACGGGLPNNKMKLTKPASARMARSSQLILVLDRHLSD